jgi:hypothetical protein
VIETPTEPIDVSDVIVSDDTHHLSLNAMNGFTSVGTIRFQGYINGRPVQLLVDGSTDNFLRPHVAKFLKLPIEAGPNFQVLVGNGNKMVAEGRIDLLKVSIQGHDLLVPVFLLPFAGADLILGSSWLATLGPHVADYSTLSLKFFYQGVLITLQGQKNVPPSHAQLHHLNRLQDTQAISEAFTLCCFSLAKKDTSTLIIPADMPSDLAQLLSQFSHIFQSPISLPPKRAHDHSIPLLDDSKVVKVRPYRYPHSQKTQIELMVVPSIISFFPPFFIVLITINKINFMSV